MTQVHDVSAALQVIDAGLGVMTDRELVSTDEVTNLLLDVRALLSEATIQPPAAPTPASPAPDSV